MSYARVALLPCLCASWGAREARRGHHVNNSEITSFERASEVPRGALTTTNDNYEYQQDRAVSGGGFTMNSADQYDSDWRGPNSYYGGKKWSSDRRRDECMELCDAEPGCKGFVDNFDPPRDSHGYAEDPFCSFKKVTDTHSDYNKDFFKKKSSPSPAPPPPPAPPNCLGGWPKFASASELRADPWGQYFTLVYGQVPPFQFPFCVGDLWHFYDDLISQSGASAPAKEGNCPTNHAWEGQRYTQNNLYQPSHVSFSWHAPPYAAIADKAWAEVAHKADPFGDEHYGLWFLWAPGNGVWFNVGTTQSFGEHQDAYTAYSINCPSPCNWNEELAKAAALSDKDSLQFVSHADHVNYPCDTAVGYLMGLEILGVKLRGLTACGSSAGAPSTIRAGWQGSSTCNCDTSQETLNCGVFASQADVAVV